MLVGKCRNVSIIVAMLIFLEPAEKVPCKNVSRIAKEGEKIFLDTLIHTAQASASHSLVK